MSDCCGHPAKPRTVCPSCGGPGRAIDQATVLALLRPEPLARLGDDEHSFCSAPECSTVYFGDRESFRREDLAAPVFQKETPGARVVCYCLGIREDRIHQEMEDAGASASADRIRELVRSGQCRCDVVNPQGTCCLGQVAGIERSFDRAAAEREASKVEPAVPA
jgi:Zinc binding domain